MSWSDSDPFGEFEEEQAEEQRAQAEELRNLEQTDFRAILRLPEGRRLIKRVIWECGLYKDSFTGNSKTYKNEGKREVGLWLFRKIVQSGASLDFIGDLSKQILEQEL